MNTVTVNINGVDYNLRGKEVEEYLQEVASFVDGKIREISATNSKLSIGSAAVLTAVNIADELFKSTSEIKELNKKKNSLEERHLTLKERLREIKLELDEKEKSKKLEVEELKNIIFSMKQKIDELDHLNETVIELNETITTLTKSNSEYEKSNMELVEEVERINSENNELKKALLNSKEEIESRVTLEEYDKIKARSEKLKLNNIEIEKENTNYKKNIDGYNREISVLKESNTELKENEVNLRKLITIKESELSDMAVRLAESNNLKLEEDEVLKKQIEFLQEEVREQTNAKETLKARNKEIKFQLQNSKYRVLDLEKKLMDSQFNLAIERKDKNPLLR